MEQNSRKAVCPSSSKVSCSLPYPPNVKALHKFLQHTPIPNNKLDEWKQGVPTPINTGDLTPNQEALSLLSGFTTGHVRMIGGNIEHLPISSPDKPISEILRELDLPRASKEKVDIIVHQPMTVKFTHKEPKSQAKLLARRKS